MTPSPRANALGYFQRTLSAAEARRRRGGAEVELFFEIVKSL
jgi:hypothetical protein